VESKTLKIFIDAHVWQKICKLAKEKKITPESMASFLFCKVQPTLEKNLQNRFNQPSAT